MARKKPIAPPERPASAQMKWPFLSPGVDTIQCSDVPRTSCALQYPTLEHLDAQQAWLAHLAAGRVKVGK